MRRLIVCCDGTWNRADWQGGTATNVIRIARAIKPMGAGANPGDPDIPQIVYYHQGVGTGDRIDRLFGGALGLGLSQNVRDAYAFIVNNYVPGDEIFLIGFSRGAFTARTVGGLIGTIGLLLKGQMGAFMDAWAFHKLDSREREARQAEFDAHFPGHLSDVKIKCIAVWDTVMALGIPKNRITGGWQPCGGLYRFHNAELGTHVAYGFQALAIDEERAPFAPVVWDRAPSAPPEQLIRQIWFAGVHSDIGGGYTDHGASDAALLWIASELVENQLLDLEADELSREFDCSAAYGAGALHRSLKAFYRILTGHLYRKVAIRPTEFVHDTVRQRIMAGGYRDHAFLKRHDGRIQPLSAFERGLSSYTVQPMTRQRPFLRENMSICEWLVRWLMGA